MIALLALGGGCTGSGEKETPAPTAANPNVITLGFVGSFSSNDADIARQVRLGAELAVAQINAAGGINGKSLALRIEDDEGRAEQAKAKFDQLVAEGVVLGIGPTRSESAEAVVDVARQNRALFISPSASSPKLDLPEDVQTDEPIPANILRTVPSDDLQSSAMVVVASQTRDQLPEDPSLKVGQARCTKIVFVYEKDSYGSPIYELARQRAVNANLNVLRTIELNPTDATEATLRGSAEQVGKVATEASADCQLVIAQPKLGGAYMRAFREYISDPVVEAKRAWGAFTTLGSDGFTQDAFVAAGRTNPADPTSDTAGNGSVAVAANTRPGSQAYSIFREAYIARNPNTEPGQFATTSYDAILILALAIEKTRSTNDLAALRRAMSELSVGAPTDASDLGLLLSRARDAVPINYEGVSGSIDFLRSGAVDGSFVIGRISNNRFVQYRKTLESSSLPR